MYVFIYMGAFLKPRTKKSEKDKRFRIFMSKPSEIQHSIQ